MPPSRRALLRRVVALGNVALAGCLNNQENSENPQGTEDLPTRFWLEEGSLSESKQNSTDPIEFGNLSAEEQEIVQTALEEGEYTVETTQESPALENLRDRIERRTGGGETLKVYLRRNDTYYRVGFAAGDHVIADSDH